MAGIEKSNDESSLDQRQDNLTQGESLPCSPLDSRSDNLVSHPKKVLTTSTKDLSTSCANCKTKKTPLWRRAPNGDTLCNACGLYSKTKNSRRPNTMTKRSKYDELDPSQDSRGTCPGDGNCNGTGGAKACDGCPVYNQQHDSKRDLVCFNCHTKTTPLWRKDRGGNIICNACGLFYKTYNSHRPISLKTAVIKRRKRVYKKASKEKSFEGNSSVEPNLYPGSVSTKELPVPSIEDIPYSSFKKNRVLEYLPQQMISFSSENDQLSNSVAPTFSPSSPYEANAHYSEACPVASAKLPTPENISACPDNFVISENDSTQFEPQFTKPAWSGHPTDTQSGMPPPIIDREMLIAHRNKIQQEVENLNQLLSSTASILQGIDRMINLPPYNSIGPGSTNPVQITLPPLRYVTEFYTPEYNNLDGRFELPPVSSSLSSFHYYNQPRDFR